MTRAPGNAAGRSGGRLRRVVARSGLLVRRRAARDAWLLLAFAVLVAMTTLLAVAGPRLVTAALDDATVRTVTDAGGRADPAVAATIRTIPEGGGADGFVSAASFATLGGFMEPPEALAAVTTEQVVTLDLGEVGVLDDDAVPRARVAMLAEGLVDDVRVVDGRLPDTAAGGDEVLISAATAARFDLEVGDRLDLAGPVRNVGPTDPDTGLRGPPAEATPVPVTVVGVVDAIDPAARIWADLSFAWQGDTATVLATESGTSALVDRLDVLGNGVVRLVVDPTAVTYERGRALSAALEEISTRSGMLTGGMRGVWQLDIALRPALDAHLAAVPAARAQMTVPLTGVVVVAGLALLLISRLLVRRRADAIVLERARGASAWSVTFRLLVESILLVGLAAGAGIAAAQYLWPGPVGDGWLMGAVVGAALVATPVQGAVIARSAWTGRRVAANRRERESAARRRGLRRVVGEVGVVVLALGAGWSLHSRGLLGGARGTDPLLAAAPLLVAVAMTVVVLRLYPWPVRALARLARRSPGVLGVVGAARARRALEPLPLLALTVGTSVAVTGMLLVDTVRSGQLDASWDRTGADVRIDGFDLGRAVPVLRAMPGVTAVSGALTANATSLDVGATSMTVALRAVDPEYAETVAELPDPPADLAAITALSGRELVDDRVPAVVDEVLAEIITRDELSIAVRGASVPLLVVGTTDHAPVGEAAGPFVYVDLATVGALIRDEANVVDTVWVQGEGAEDAAEAVAAEFGVGPDGVHTRSGWLTDRRAMPLVNGVEQAMLIGTAAVGLLAVLVLGATVLAGARERGRTLSLLRTLGMRARLGWWLALAELAPVVAAAVISGAASGVVVVLLLGRALGLDVLVGGVGMPPPTVEPAAIGMLAAGGLGLLIAAALVEVGAHRRERLSDVLRVGETTT